MLLLNSVASSWPSWPPWPGLFFGLLHLLRTHIRLAVARWFASCRCVPSRQRVTLHTLMYAGGSLTRSYVIGWTE
jgi:hypothetical protein